MKQNKLTSQRLWLATILLLLAIRVSAQDTLHTNKIITNAQMIGIGSVNVLDTYLSPEEYRGGELRYISLTERENGTRISRELVHQAHLLSARNRAENNKEIGGWYNFQYNVHYKLLDATLGKSKLTVKAGGGVDANLGFLYNMRNSNNPAQAYLQVNLAPSIIAAYSFRVKGHPILLRYEAQAPLVGLTFSPNYGQSYYELFSKNNYDHNIVFTTIGSTPSVRQFISADYTIHHTTLRIGYEADLQQAKLNGLKYHTWSNLFVIGLVRKFNLTKILP